MEGVTGSSPVTPTILRFIGHKVLFEECFLKSKELVTSEKLRRLNAGSIITAFQTEEIHANELRDV
jgi:hypothetical protein